MKSREEILKDVGKTIPNPNYLSPNPGGVKKHLAAILEVLFDIRDLKRQELDEKKGGKKNGQE